jgi:hypothetical protein
MVRDFMKIDPSSPIPNLLALIHTSKLFCQLQILDSLEGNWDEGVEQLLSQINFGKKMGVFSRALINQIISKFLIRDGLWTLSCLMNREECPRHIYQKILDGLPDLGYKEYGTRNAFVAELVVSQNCIDGNKHFEGNFNFISWLFIQKNRTKKYLNDYFTKFILEYEKTPPYKWKGDLLDMVPKYNGWFWWLHNPGGKVFYRKWIANNHEVILRSYRLKTWYDMVKISAELHLKYDPEQPMEENLHQLKTYNKLFDPCTGKPYKWNEEKQVLYSFGVDRDDDLGVVAEKSKEWDTDFAIPVILFVKSI